jgi:two-component system nitrate/nitrite response regulator NarL
MRALIVDDHVLFAQAVRPTLESLGLEVRSATRASEAMGIARRETIDLVLLDLALPDQDGLSFGREVLEEFPHMRVLALTARDDPTTVAEALRLGFSGYLTKDLPVSEFARSLRVAIDGQVVVPERPDPLRADGSADDGAGLLTPREREVLRLLLEAASGAEIARSLSISRNTVRSHIHNILTKLQVHSRLEAAAWAARNGLAEAGRR